MEKTFAGPRLRQLITDRQLSQVDVARLLEISPSYLNQLLHNQRPLTVPVLLKLTEVFGVDTSFFSGDDTTRLSAELRDVFADLGVSTADAAELARHFPDSARAVTLLHHRYRQASEQVAALSGDREPAAGTPMPHEEVRTFLYRHKNHFAGLDQAAESLAALLDLPDRRAHEVLSRRLGIYGVRIAVSPENADDLHRFDPKARVLHLSERLGPGRQAFRMAGHLAFIEQEDQIAELTAQIDQDETRTLARIALANYFAAALLLPYGDFLATAERFRYDVERLAEHYGAGFEMICHRLSTLQRPRARGVPFSFIRVDRAGNMSKHQSASGFHFTRTGGTCALWRVYEAFAAPGRVLRQIAVMPDGKHYFWIARTVTQRPHRYGAPGKTFAIGLGCELRHAGRLVYSSGLDLTDRAAAVPIGPGCRTCVRDDCAQRAVPQIGKALAIDENSSRLAPYPTEFGRPPG
ncbi:short-chain fatty acyl-CoA regulator family protein [Kineosporia babensis]|uniref:Short-chain fatty acyl-CoA regulator family protein n=1 Tax=Kineosporia babensis TaxID=499548 RepID=A0A9X1NBU7_9ACTN|nr:short-chain fatty acyl-CoA regulator family protein [Kineosporia babensis]